MENRVAYCICLVALSLLALSFVDERQSARATEIEKWLIMPAPVTASHAEFEAECKSCHAPLSDQPQSELCIVCHTEVGDDTAQQSGFHGRLPEPQRMNCASCHTDHEGRDMNIVDLDEATFDHKLTDFALHGAHATVACSDCHSAGSPRREAPSACVDCHRPDDVHKEQLGHDCGSCHTDSNWSEAKFDHHSTGFALRGAHKDATCNACHMSEDFATVGRTCVACHQSDDVHKGRNGAQCADCHNSSTWKDSTFDHFAIAGFGLVGEHEGVACDSCHRSANFNDLGGTSCNSCHARDDTHQGRFGTNCGSCHNVFGWASGHYNHKRETGFELPAGHGDLSCDACHTGKLEQALPVTCGQCHASDDLHRGQLGERCESCHVSTSWVAELRFDHDITSFPLIGAHAGIACQRCHATVAFHDADGNCISCHGDSDVHRGALGEQCDSCHNPNSWRAWQFDHDTHTNFPLTGSHTEIECNACHMEKTTRPDALRRDCNSCHRRDDAHAGRFGNNCEACHTTSSFREVEGM